ncbi:hypothetical protein ACRAWB_18265 [Leifsonia poae]|uniref:hypothetical protein n=1 Tax=Leifsonia poae TaxID=110933 RepID=UPI003D68A68C
MATKKSSNKGGQSKVPVGTEQGVNDRTPAEVQQSVDRQRYDQQFGAGAYDRMRRG